MKSAYVIGVSVGEGAAPLYLNDKFDKGELVFTTLITKAAIFQEKSIACKVADAFEGARFKGAFVQCVAVESDFVGKDKDAEKCMS